MEIKLFNLNCWLLPPPFSVKNKKRLNNIIRFIEEYNPHVFTLQEVWLNKYVREIKKLLPRYEVMSARSFLYNKSGLVTGLRIPKDSTVKKKFKTRRYINFYELLARKGFQNIRLKNGLNIINTHLYGPLRRNRLDITFDQFGVLKKWADQLNETVVLAGDINMESHELNQLNGGFFHESFDDKHTLVGLNPYTEMRLNRFGKTNMKLDYVLAHTKKDKIDVSTDVLETPYLSDHLAVTATITF